MCYDDGNDEKGDEAVEVWSRGCRKMNGLAQGSRGHPGYVVQTPEDVPALTAKGDDEVDDEQQP